MLLGSRSEAFREQVQGPQTASYGEGCARDFDPGRGSLLLQPPSLRAGAYSPSSQHGARSCRGTEHAGRSACFRGQDRRRSKGVVREVLSLLERNRLDLRRLGQAPHPASSGGAQGDQYQVEDGCVHGFRSSEIGCSGSQPGHCQHGLQGCRDSCRLYCH